MSDKKKKLLKELIIIFVLLVVVGLLIIVLLGKKTYSSSDMDESLRKMASDFYVNYYYDDISSNKSKEEVADYLKQFKDMGIKIDLENLIQYDESNKDKIEETFVKNGIQCDKEGTKAIIYPKEPYEKNDYSIETIIDCP